MHARWIGQLVAATLLVGLASGCAPGLTANDDWELQVNARWQTCEADADCVAVENQCSSCCQQIAIRADLLSRWNEEFDRVCSDYDDGSCDCVLTAVTPRCDDGACVLE